MRVLIAADSLGALDTLRAGSALATAWAERGAQVAVVPIGGSGGGFVQAVAASEGVDVSLVPTHVGEPVAVCVDAGDTVAVALEGGEEAGGIRADASSALLGRAVAEVLRSARPETLYVDLAWARGAHDGGAGFLAGLGAEPADELSLGLSGLSDVAHVDLGPVRDLLAGVDLVGVVPATELRQPLLGLRGISSTRGFAAGLDLEATMAADNVLERYCAAVAPRAATLDGAGACGGAGFAVLALGGRIVTGTQECADRVTLSRTLQQCDLVVTACDRYDFYTRGGPVVDFLADACAAAGRPLIVVARERIIGNREMRSMGVEDAYALEIADPTEESVRDAAAPIARTWSW